MGQLLFNNVPECLIALGEKWNSFGKSFYLGPENIFMFNSTPIDYAGAENISKEDGSWFICTEDQQSPLRSLYKEEIEEISCAFAMHSKPDKAIIYVDYRCNSKCHVCCFHGTDTSYYDENLSSSKVTISVELAKERINKLIAAGIKNLCIVSNGEILVYKHWEELFRYAVSKGASIGFNTNGFLLSEERIKILADIGNISWIEVSLHSIDFDIWSSFTGVTNRKIFDRVQNAPILLKKYGIPSCVAAVKTDKTINGLSKYLEFWIPKVDQVTIGNQINNDIFSNYEPYYGEPLGICIYSRRTYYILPNGNIMPCGTLALSLTDNNINNLPKYNIDNFESIDDITAHFEKDWQNKVYREVCARCPFKCINSESIFKKAYGYKCVTEGVISNRYTLGLNQEKFGYTPFYKGKFLKPIINCIPSKKLRRKLRNKYCN